MRSIVGLFAFVAVAAACNCSCKIPPHDKEADTKGRNPDLDNEIASTLKTFQVEKVLATWHEASSFCSARGHRLATINGAKEYKLAVKAIRDSDPKPEASFWLRNAKPLGELMHLNSYPIAESSQCVVMEGHLSVYNQLAFRSCSSQNYFISEED